MNSQWRELEAAVGSPVSRETFERVLAFQVEFERWAHKINLVAPSTMGDIWNRHILDSAQLMRYGGNAASWLDIGSGGGFPGAVVAILRADSADSRIHLVESVAKKAAFLRTVLAKVDVGNALVHAARVERLRDSIDVPAIVSARAVASLPVLLNWSSPWLQAGAKALFQKGRDFAAEVEESLHAWRFDLVEHASVIDPASVILEISNLQRR